ncbi:hypothetical protein Tco_0986199, partial [Tanacetum coccineum]
MLELLKEDLDQHNNKAFVVRLAYLKRAKKSDNNRASVVGKDFQDSPNYEKDTRSSQEYMNDLEMEFHKRTLLAKSAKHLLSFEHVFVPDPMSRDGNGSGNYGDRTYHPHPRFLASPIPVLIPIGESIYIPIPVPNGDRGSWNGYLRKGRKTKPKRQNRTRNGKDCERQSQIEAE